MLIKVINGTKHIYKNDSVMRKKIVLPLQLLFKSMLEEGIFLVDCKKSNVVPVYKNYSFSLKLLITHEIYNRFDCNSAVDMKDFDKVWHEGLIFKLKSYGTDGDLLTLLTSYLEDCTQRVVLNGKTSSWKKKFEHVALKVPFRV